MYNEDIKQKFIDGFTNSVSRKKTATTLFNALSKYEEAWGADICTKTKDELKDVITEIAGFRVSSVNTRLSILRLYAKWCMQHQIPNACNGLLQIEGIGIEKLKRQTVANPQHLQEYLNCICDSESEETVDCVCRGFYWLAYSGIPEKDALEIAVSDVHLDDMEIYYDGVCYPIYKEAIPALRNCVRLTQFRYKHPRYDAVYKNRAVGDKLLRGFTDNRSLASMQSDMSRRAKNPKFMKADQKDNKRLDLNLSYYRVSISGLYYRMFEYERAGVEPDFTAAAKRFMEGRVYNLQKSRNLIGAKQRSLAADYLEDYLRWKEAYSV